MWPAIDGASCPQIAGQPDIVGRPASNKVSLGEAYIGCVDWTPVADEIPEVFDHMGGVPLKPVCCLRIEPAAGVLYPQWFVK